MTTPKFLKTRCSIGRRLLPAVTGSLAIVLCLGLPASSQETARFFRQSCASCHWIGGGRLIGPDLKNVTQRVDRDWLVRFIVDPQSILNARDPYAMKLQAEAKGAVMINVLGMTREKAEALLDLIEAESKLDSSQFAGKVISTGPYSEAEAAQGRDIFTGKARLVNAGASCTSCHTVNVVEASLGGQLGPDLTQVFDRLQGRNALTAWLSAPPTATMQTVFAKHQIVEEEVKTLVAFFESVSLQTGPEKHLFMDSFVIWLLVILGGLGGTVVGLIIMGGIWSNRFRAARRPLIETSKNLR